MLPSFVGIGSGQRLTSRSAYEIAMKLNSFLFHTILHQSVYICLDEDHVSSVNRIASIDEPLLSSRGNLKMKESSENFTSGTHEVEDTGKTSESSSLPAVEETMTHTQHAPSDVDGDYHLVDDVEDSRVEVSEDHNEFAHTSLRPLEEDEQDIESNHNDTLQDQTSSFQSPTIEDVNSVCDEDESDIADQESNNGGNQAEDQKNGDGEYEIRIKCSVGNPVTEESRHEVVDANHHNDEDETARSTQKQGFEKLLINSNFDGLKNNEVLLNTQIGNEENVPDVYGATWTVYSKSNVDETHENEEREVRMRTLCTMYTYSIIRT